MVKQLFHNVDPLYRFSDFAKLRILCEMDSCMFHCFQEQVYH